MRDESQHNDPLEPDDLPELPPELRALDRELRSLHLSERESFAPELEAELARAWREMPRRPRRTGRRAALAAGLATLLLVSLGVPPARAGLARIIVAVQDGATELFTAPDELEAPGVEMDPAPRERLSDVEAIRDLLALPEVGEEETEVAEEPSFTVPVLADATHARELVESFYPREIRTRGRGGTARLLLWVDEGGRVADARLDEGSGIAELDRAALAVAPYLRFHPASREGDPAGSWVDFDVEFTPPVPELHPSFASPEAPELAVPDVGPEPEEWLGEPGVVAPEVEAGARGLLRSAVNSERRTVLAGELDELLAGEPPPGALPLQWREDAIRLLQAAVDRDPSNPAPFLALARIRMRQGLRSDARRLYERGIQRAGNGGDGVPPAVVADLHYERGLMIREEWLPWEHLGKVPSVALQTATCYRAPTPPSSQRYAPADILIAWNYLCPAAFEQVMTTRMEPLEGLKESSRTAMLRALYDAVEASPGHVKASTDLLLEMADAGDWEGLLEAAHTFVSASDGHPNAHLLIGLALHRLGRSRDAAVRFHQGLALLPTPQATTLLSPEALLSRDEARRFELLTEVAREAAIRDFWAPLDPLLSTAVNEREVEHLARSAYALLRFGGSRTDAGRLWIRYGRPYHVRSFGEGTMVRTEFWDYGPGPDVTFQRSASQRELTATTEARAYLEELRGVFPHRYAPAAGEILPLTGQRARFRAGDGTGMELEIHTRVPEALLQGVEEGLELGVFLLSPEGRRWTVERRTVDARPHPVNLVVPLEPEANRVVVELHNPVTGRAASLRTPVSTGDLGPPGEPTISDLLLVEPASIFGKAAVERAASWVRPMTRPDVPVTENTGVLFEVYDLPRGTAGYFLRVVLEDLESGNRRPLAFKPAGELEFRRMWEQRLRGRDVVTEYLTVDLTDLPAGAYLLRVEVSSPETGVELKATRALDLG